MKTKADLEKEIAELKAQLLLKDAVIQRLLAQPPAYVPYPMPVPAPVQPYPIYPTFPTWWGTCVDGISITGEPCMSYNTGCVNTHDFRGFQVQ